MSTQLNIGTEELTSPTVLKAALAEFLATGLFVFMSVGSIIAMLLTAGDLGGGIVIIAAAFGLSIAVLAAAFGPISGGHINPAVSFAMVITGRVSVVRGVMYIVAQCAGAAAGMALLRAFVLDEILLEVPGAGGDAINNAVVSSDLAAVGIEATITFLLVWTIFATAVNPRGSGTLAPVFIGFAVFVIHLFAIPLTGTGANPARTFGPALIMGRWDDHWVYWIGPLLGASIAAITYTLLYLSDDDSPA